MPTMRPQRRVKGLQKANWGRVGQRIVPNEGECMGRNEYRGFRNLFEGMDTFVWLQLLVSALQCDFVWCRACDVLDPRASFKKDCITLLLVGSLFNRLLAFRIHWMEFERFNSNICI